MNRAKVWGWRLLVGVAALLFASGMLILYMEIFGLVFDADMEATYREWEAVCRSEGNLAQALQWKRNAELESWRKFRGRLGIAACLSSLAVFLAAALVKRRSSRPSVNRAATFLTRSMFLGFLLSVVALIALYAAAMAFVFLWEE